MKSGQVSLQYLFVLLTATAVLFRAAVFAGWTYFAWISVVSFLVFLLCFAWAVAPRATSHGLALLAVGIVFISILVCWIDQARAIARRQQCGDNLRRFGVGLQERQIFACPPIELTSPAATD
jgi:hypothetical protein